MRRSGYSRAIRQGKVDVAMAGMFIDVEVDSKVASDPKQAASLVEVCPVDIFAQDDEGALKVVDENLDECVLCNLCVHDAPEGAITIKRLYD